VDKDVRRSDSSHPYFAGEDNQNPEVLRRILLSYSLYNFDLGYCQVVLLHCLRWLSENVARSPIIAPPVCSVSELPHCTAVTAWRRFQSSAIPLGHCHPAIRMTISE